MAKLNATFFALQPRDRAVLLPATLVFLLLMAIVIGAWILLNWGTIARVIDVFPRLAGGETTDETTAMGMVTGMFTLAGTAMLFLFPLYIVVAAYEAACLRWMIRGEAPGLFGITLDNDTWRVYGVYWCWFIAQFAASTAMSILTMPFVLASMGEVMRNPNDMEAMWRWQLQVQLPLTFLQYVPLIFIGVRFGPGAATSIARERFSFLDAWTVTRGRFWELLGSFALLWLIWLVVALAASAPAVMRMWPHLAAVFTPTATQEDIRAYLNAYMAPETWMWVGIGYGVMAIAGLLMSITFYGVNARAALAALEEGKIQNAAGQA